MGRVKSKRGVRSARRGIYFCEVSFDRVERGYAERLVPRERVATDEVRAVLNATVDAFLDGKAKPFNLEDSGYNAAREMKYIEIEKYRDKDNPALVRGKRIEVELQRKHVAAAKYYRTTDDGEEYDHDTGKKVVPWVHITMADGSQADVDAVKPKGK